ncbi:MAG: hypothetical protein ABEJ73_11435 [Haloplanus sp.]
MSSSTDPSKRIPKSLGTDTQLLGQYSLTDLLVAGMPGVIVILVTQVVLPKSLRIVGVPVTTLTIPVAVLAIGVGALFVYLTPAYTTSIDWLEQFVGFHTSETEIAHKQAKEYTQVERILPSRDAIVRTDGALVGAVHVDPPTMALATDEEWRTKTEAFQDFVNTTVDFPIQIYSTTQAFPADEYLQQYEDRLHDSDVKANEKLESLIEHYVEWYERELAQRQMTIRDHYVLVPVTPQEVRFERDGLAAKLADLPLLGVVIRAATSPPVSEERAAMADELDERIRQVERGLRGIKDIEASRLDAEELAKVIGEFWAGQHLDYGDLSHRIRTTPLITRTDS